MSRKPKPKPDTAPVEAAPVAPVGEQPVRWVRLTRAHGDTGVEVLTTLGDVIVDRKEAKEIDFRAVALARAENLLEELAGT